MNPHIRIALERFVDAKPWAASYRERLTRLAIWYDEWLALRSISTFPFTKELIAAWLLEQSETAAPATINVRRQGILTIARHSPDVESLWVRPLDGFKKPPSPSPRIGIMEAAQVLGIDRATLRKKAEAGEIPSVLSKGRRLFTRKDLRRWLLTRRKRRKRPVRTWRLTDHLDRTVERYIPAHDLCVKQQERLRRHVRLFEDFIFDSGPAMLRENDAGRVNAWLTSLVGERAPATINGHRQSIMALLRFATPEGHPLPRTDRIRRQREPDDHRAAFTREELLRLIEAAPDYRPMTIRKFGRGKHSDAVPRHRPDGVPWAIWWEAFVRVGYESGQYLSDLRLIPWSRLAFDGSVSFVRHKTGKSMAFQLSPEAIKAAKRLGDSELILPWNYDMAAYFSREFKKFVRTVKGVRVLGPKSIRRAAVTYTYIDQGEEAARVLAGHSSFSITAKHYIDWAIARRRVVAPPSLQPSR